LQKNAGEEMKGSETLDSSKDHPGCETIARQMVRRLWVNKVSKSVPSVTYWGKCICKGDIR
jgi:hypothetical protein